MKNLSQLFLFLSLSLLCMQCTSDTDPKTGPPLIKKLGTIDCDLVETTPIVFKGKLYRFEYVRERYKLNQSGKSHFRFIDHQSGEATAPFARGYHLGSAYAENDSVYVTAVDIWNGEHIEIFVSADLINWHSRPVLNLPGYGIFNTSLCKADGQYVLMYELGKPVEEVGERFTARFATSADLQHWTVTDRNCVFLKERYSAPHCLRYLDGYFYVFYVEELKGDSLNHYETYVVRSRDLVDWQYSPLNPVMRASADDKKIANPDLTDEQRARIAAAVNINNSDMDFCEFKGRVIINYSWGDQHGTEFLAGAVYEGNLAQFLKGWFPETKIGK
jgi:hypothetical protein